MSLVIADDSLLEYALRFALQSDDVGLVGYACHRLSEASQYMDLGACAWLIQRIDDEWSEEWGYLKQSPVRQLREKLELRRREFKGGIDGL